MARNKNKEPSPAGSEEEFEVASIVGHKIDPENPDRVHYLYRIRWVGYKEDDDTWEPKESLEGGAEGILEEYIATRREEGDIFFKEGYRKEKIQPYLEKNDLSADRLGYDAFPPEKKKKKSKSSNSNGDSSSTKEARRKKEDLPIIPATSAADFIEVEKEKKRKKRESQAAAEAEEEESARRQSSSHHHENKKSRRTSDSPLPPPLSKSSRQDRAEKENGDNSQSRKPSSKRSANAEDDSPQARKKRPSSAQQQESDDDAAAAREMEQMKRSPLKEKKADQRKSEEPSSQRKPVSTEKSKVPLSSSTPNKAPVVAAAAEEEESDLILGSTINAKLSSWEDLLTVESLEQDMSSIAKEYKWFVSWNDDSLGEEWITNDIARKKCPQKLLSFYEDHLKFKSNPEMEDNEMEGQGAVNGDDAAMDQD